MSIGSLIDIEPADNSGDGLDELEKMANEVMFAKNEADAAAERYKELDTAFRARLADHGMWNKNFRGLGAMKATVSSNVKFDETLAREVLPAEIIEQATTKLDSAIIKRLVSPVVYEQCQKDNGLKVTYTIAK